MSKNAVAVRTISVVCACGASFDREVKRGRPQVWCPSCVEVPFAKRSQVEPTVQADGTPAAAPAVRKQYDDLGHVREQLEADVQTFYAEFPAVRAALQAEGKTGIEIALAQGDGLRAVYARYRNN